MNIIYCTIKYNVLNTDNKFSNLKSLDESVEHKSVALNKCHFKRDVKIVLK